MPKSENFKAPAIVGKAKEEPKQYFFRNSKNPGTTVSCFMGDCPKAGEWFKDTVKQQRLVDGQTVSLTESEYEHLRERGIEKPITQEDEMGNKHMTGQTYIDRRFDLYPV